MALKESIVHGVRLAVALVGFSRNNDILVCLSSSSSKTYVDELRICCVVNIHI